MSAFFRLLAHRAGRRAPAFVLLSSLCAIAQAAPGVIVWPPGWQPEPLDPAAHRAPGAERQRAAMADANGDPAMVVELTRSAVARDHHVDLGAVVLAMRKAVQTDFAKGGYQSACTPVHAATLGDLPAQETTCKVLLNGGHVMTQTLVAATLDDAAWALSYAGSVQGYAAHESAVAAIRDSLKFHPQP